jgi:hypothetical protein
VRIEDQNAALIIGGAQTWCVVPTAAPAKLLPADRVLLCSDNLAYGTLAVVHTFRLVTLKLKGHGFRILPIGKRVKRELGSTHGY